MTETKLTPIGTAVPAHLQASNPEAGLIKNDRDLMSRPMLKLVSDSAKLFKDGDCQDGRWWSDVHGKDLGGINDKKKKTCDPVQVVPLAFRLCWQAFSNDMKLLWKLLDPDCPGWADAKVPTSREDATLIPVVKGEEWRYKTMEVLVAVPFNNPDAIPEVQVMSMGSTQFKIAREWYRQAKKISASTGTSVSSVMWELGVKQDKNDKDQLYWVPTIRQLGYVPEVQHDIVQQLITETMDGFNAEKPRLPESTELPF